MAKKEERPKVVLERTYNIPLRKEFLKVPKYKRSKKAITALRKFLKRHMKSDRILLGKHLNELIWSHGIKNPPHHIQVTTVKDDQGVVRAELIGKPIYEPEPAVEKKTKKKEEKEEPTEVKEAEAPIEMKEEVKEITPPQEAPSIPEQNAEQSLEEAVKEEKPQKPKRVRKKSENTEK